MFEETQWKNLQLIYKNILSDILENKNIEKHLKDVDTAINELEEIILKERSTGKLTLALDDIKNDFYYLKYEILERL